ncbi:MAG: hypothetical protein RJA94_51 [Pseudomonadota bacterium]
MSLDAPMTDRDPAPRRGTVDSFRLLTARLKRLDMPPPPPVPMDEPPPLPAASVALPPAPPDPGAAASALLDIVWGAVDLPPQERSMAGDTLLLLLPKLSIRDLGMLAERIAAMDQPPPLLLSRLVSDSRPEVGGVLLERSAHLDQSDMLAACRDGDHERLRLLARRRHVPAVLSDRLVDSGDLLCQLVLLRNPGADISFRSFLRLSQMAGEHPGLQVPLALRADLPLAVALDLLWRLPPELRRVVIARFLSDSVTLGRILAIGLAAGGTPLPPDGAAPLSEVEGALEALLAGRRPNSVARFASLAGITQDTVERIFADSDGEAMVVLLKALGLGRSRIDDALDRIRAGTGLISEGRMQEELKAMFDALSFTKARVLLTYWDWFTRRVGPYSELAEPGLVEAGPLA